MKSEEPSLVSRTRYYFHNMIVKGTQARIVAFTIVTLATCVILGIILSLVPGTEGSLLTSIWNTILCALDGGTIAGMEANTGQKAILFTVTLVGIILTSVLVGIITTGIDEWLDDISHEGSKVLERQEHLLVLGYTSLTPEILHSLAQSNEKGSQTVPIVVLEGEREIVEVSKEIQSRLWGLKKTKTIFRQGYPYSEADLDLCSIEHAHSILVTTQSDEEALKTVLVCSGMLQKLGRPTPIFVICENREEFGLVQVESDVPIYLINPVRMLANVVDVMQREHPSTPTVLAGESIEVPDEATHLIITANHDVEREESDNLVLRTLLGLHSLRQKRREEGNPLTITCMLYFDRNVDPIKRAGADETILVGRLLTERVGRLVKLA